MEKAELKDLLQETALVALLADDEFGELAAVVDPIRYTGRRRFPQGAEALPGGRDARLAGGDPGDGREHGARAAGIMRARPGIFLQSGATVSRRPFYRQTAPRGDGAVARGRGILREGWRLVPVEALHSATLDEHTREEIGGAIFDRWVQAQRRKATIEMPFRDER